jgi:3-oxoacyl-[acyl-carrier protein] reductase
MKINLQNQIILITGASSGIGKAMVKSFTEAGATIAIHYNSNSKSAALLAEEAGNNSKSFQANLSQPIEAEKLFDNVLNHYGQVSTLINNAGIFEYSPISSKNWLEMWHRTMDTNLTSVALLCKSAIEHFLKIKGGRIINISSRAAFRGDTKDYLAYAASKGGMVALTKSIARAYGKDNIKAFSIAPGFVRTPMADTFMEKNGEKKVLDEIALPELTLPEDISPTAVFLASGINGSCYGLHNRYKCR